MKIINRLSVIILLAFFITPVSQAAVSVIVHPENNNQLTDRQIKNLFLGKTKVFPDGSKVETYDINEGETARVDFLRKALHKSESNFNAHWARMLFSSKGEPPREVANQDEMIKTVASNKNSIGYVDSSKVTSQVKVIMEFE